MYWRRKYYSTKYTLLVTTSDCFWCWQHMNLSKKKIGFVEGCTFGTKLRERIKKEWSQWWWLTKQTYCADRPQEMWRNDPVRPEDSALSVFQVSLTLCCFGYSKAFLSVNTRVCLQICHSGACCRNTLQHVFFLCVAVSHNTGLFLFHSVLRTWYITFM